MGCKYKTVLFDLDGTLSKSGEGVKKGITHTLNALKMPVPDLSDYSLYVGPPLIDTFEKLCNLPKEMCSDAVKLYGEYYTDKGKYENKLYSGTDTLLKTLKENGITLAVTTTKNEDFAKWVLKFLGIADYFDTVSGVNADYSVHTKTQVILNALKRLNITDLSSCVLIGDSVFDAVGASEVGIDFIGVEYGYGKLDEMREKGAKYLAKDAHDLCGYLLRN